MKGLWKKKVMSGALAVLLCAANIPGTQRVSAIEEAGIPYTPEGNYSVFVEHVMIHQIYGASDDGAASHSFIELYNPCDSAVNLAGWEVQYRSSLDGEHQSWNELTLTGVIPAKGYYLIRCGASGRTDYFVPQGDQEWDIQLHNKGISVALFSEDVTLGDDFAGAVTEENRPEGYVDLLAVQGNDEEEVQQPPVYEADFAPEQSKKKAVRRVNFIDTDHNRSDIAVVDYSDLVDETNAPHNSKGETGGKTPSQPSETIVRENSFEENANLTMERLNSLSIGTPNADGGVAEIVAYNADRKEAYVVNGQDGLLYRLRVSESGLTKIDSKDLRSIAADFHYGDMTSVAVDLIHDRIAVALQAEEYNAAGRVVLLDYDFNLVACYETGVQPDMVTFTHDENQILTADEGEPRMGYGEEVEDPAGSVTIIDIADETVTCAGFSAFDSADLAESGVLIGKVNGQLNAASVDLEPEYIVVSKDDSKAYISLQEANAIATLDLKSKTIVSVKSMGFKDLGLESNAVDLQEDGTYQAKTYPDAVGVYMPDSISLYEANGVSYLITANEGDSRDWPDYSNEAKVTLTAADGSQAEKVRALDKTLTSVPDESKEYLYGGRSFAIYKAETMELVYESGNDFEEKTAGYLADWFNCSNDDIETDSRSAKKGPEPESVTVGMLGEKVYAFIALERIGGIMAYDVTDPANVQYVNYINTRDFSAEIKEDVSPEGLCFLFQNGSPMLLAACEVSGTVAAYSFGGADSLGEETHLFIEVQRVEATEKQDGFVKYVCSFCGTEKTEPLKWTGNAENHETGEGSEWIAVLCLGLGAGLLALALWMAKSRKENAFN